MCVNYYENFGFYHITNFFSEEEYALMFDELSWLCDDELLLNPTDSGGKSYARTSRGLPIESFMPASDSYIIQKMNKMCDLDLKFDLSKYKSTHLINHYMGGQRYDYHTDECDYTAITTFYKDPRPYLGGTLVFWKDNVEMTMEKFLSRDLIIFPGSLHHKVTPIQMLKNNVTNMDARISVSRFMKL